MTETPEAKIENKFVDYAKEQGCHALKLRIDGQVGFPDRTVLTPCGVLFIEFKRPRGRLSRSQVAWLGILRGLGFTAISTDSFHAACRALDYFLEQGR